MSAQSPEYQPQFSLWVRQLLTVLLVIVGIYLLTLVAPVLPMLTVAFLLAFVMFIPSRALARRTPIPYALSVILLYTCLIFLIVLGLLVITPSLVAGITSLINSLQQGYTELVVSLQHLKPENAIFEVLGVQIDLSDIVRTLQGALNVSPNSSFISPDQLTNPIRVQQAALGNLINQILPLFGSVSQIVTGAIAGVTGFFGSFLLAVFVSFLVLLDIPITQKMMARQIPPAYHREFALLVQKVVHVWNGFFRGQVLIGFAIGVLTFLQLSWMGISNSFILAVITGTVSLIPTIGGILALFPLALIPLITGSTAFPDLPHVVVALLVVGVNLIISQMIWNIVAPKILGDALDLPLPVIIVGVFVGAAAGGVLGAFLAAPMMATLRVIVAYVWHKINQDDPFVGETAPFEWETDSFAYQGTFHLVIPTPMSIPLARTWWRNHVPTLPDRSRRRHSGEE